MFDKFKIVVHIYVIDLDICVFMVSIAFHI